MSDRDPSARGTRAPFPRPSNGTRRPSPPAGGMLPLVVQAAASQGPYQNSYYTDAAYSSPPPRQTEDRRASLRTQNSFAPVRTDQFSRPRPSATTYNPGPRDKGGSLSAGGTAKDRMQNTGWVGPASTPTSPGLDKRGSADSGFSEGSAGDGGKSQAGYFGNWGKLKGVIWGEIEEDAHSSPFTEEPHSESQIWTKIKAVTVARGEEDDDTVGPDGDTKLTRFIKEYHISRATCIADLPTWLFSPSELSARTPAASRVVDDSERGPRWQPTVPSRAASAPIYHAHPSAQDFDPFAGSRNRSGSDGTASESYPAGTGSRTANRLRQMREEKRHMY